MVTPLEVACEVLESLTDQETESCRQKLCLLTLECLCDAEIASSYRSFDIGLACLQALKPDLKPKIEGLIDKKSNKVIEC